MTSAMLVHFGALAEAATGEGLACCVFVRDLIRRWSRRPLTTQGALWCIWPDSDGTVPPSRVWGPVDAAISEGVAEARAESPGYRWTIAQGWRGLLPDGTADPAEGSQGHTFLVRALGGPEEWVLIAESDERNGPRVRVARWSSVKRSWPSGIALAVLIRPADEVD